MSNSHKSSPSSRTLHTPTRTHRFPCPCSRLEQTHISPAMRASSSLSAQSCCPMASQASAAPPMCAPATPLRPLSSTSPCLSPAGVTSRGRVLASAASGARDPKIAGTPSQNRPTSLSPERRATQAAAAPSDGSLAWQVQRPVSDQPQGSVYSGPASPSPKRVTLRVLRSKYSRGEPITMVTAYDYPSAVHVDEAGIDILLVGDSVAMVVHGHDTTLPISMDEMLVHCRAAARGARRAFLVGDMPFGSYETGTRDAVISAMRMLKEGGMDAVKLEGGSPARVEAARAIVEAGIAVVGHVGLTPQAISVIGGFRPQAQVAEEALSVLTQAQALQKAGCFAIVLECVPAPIAAAVTAALDIPTIGIGAGSATSGQVLVYHDLLGMMSHPHHAKVTPKFCKQYAHVGSVIQAALQEYRDEVTSRAFPSARYSPYRIPEPELTVLVHELRQRGAYTAAHAAEQQYMADQSAASGVAPPAPAAAPAPTITSITQAGTAPALTVPTVTSITNGIGH